MIGENQRIVGLDLHVHGKGLGRREKLVDGDAGEFVVDLGGILDRREILLRLLGHGIDVADLA